jgi:hypothetical protein
MRASFLSTVLAIIGGAAAVQSLSVVRAEKCVVPSWTVTNLTVWYSSENSGAKAGHTTFTITSILHNITETLSCNIPFNSHCEFYGTPGNKNLTILTQFSGDVAYLTLNEDFSCAEGEK